MDTQELTEVHPHQAHHSCHEGESPDEARGYPAATALQGEAGTCVSWTLSPPHGLRQCCSKPTSSKQISNDRFGGLTPQPWVSLRPGRAQWSRALSTLHCCLLFSPCLRDISQQLGCHLHPCSKIPAPLRAHPYLLQALCSLLPKQHREQSPDRVKPGTLTFLSSSPSSRCGLRISNKDQVLEA